MPARRAGDCFNMSSFSAARKDDLFLNEVEMSCCAHMYMNTTTTRVPYEAG